MAFGFGSKGDIEIKLDKVNYTYGETIKGKVILKVDKPVKAKELRLVFKGEKEERRKVMAGKQVRTKIEKTVIHNFKLVLDGEKEYSGNKEYPFEITIPEKQKNKPPEGLIGTFVKTMDFLQQTQTKTEWYLTATLDIPMSTDINKKIQINIV